ncbi:DUF6676 family protein [Mycolicibacterium sp.]|uniref:Rv1476 family membrane protein n=1 Tax=Mycolicibacterium sp. TaxID=2320850 RepID=UPI003D11F10B
MSGLTFVPNLPAYIPPELCQSVGIEMVLGEPAPDACMDLVRENVAETGVSVPVGTDAGVAAALGRVVEDAASQGIDLKIVVIDRNPPIHTPLRDIATEVGEANPGSTVLAISPSFAGTYSAEFDRVTLEAGEDVAKTGDPVVSSHNFVSELTTSHFPWTPFSIVLVIAVALAVVGTRLLQNWGKRHAAAESVVSSED